MFEDVTCAIPGAKRVEQVEENIRAADLPPLSAFQMEQVRTIYENSIKEQVHQLW